MSDPALRANVITALKNQSGIVIQELADGSIEVAKVGEPVRRLLFKPTVSRGMLAKLERWYGIPMAAYYPSTATMPESNAAGE